MYIFKCKSFTPEEFSYLIPNSEIRGENISSNNNLTKFNNNPLHKNKTNNNYETTKLISDNNVYNTHINTTCENKNIANNENNRNTKERNNQNIIKINNIDNNNEPNKETKPNNTSNQTSHIDIENQISTLLNINNDKSNPNHKRKREWSISPGSISPHQVASIWGIKNNSRDKHHVIYK